MENQINDSVKKPNGFIKFLNGLKHGLKKFYKEVICFPAYILTHPIAGWTEFKNEKRGKMSVSITIILLYVVMKMLEYKYQGPVMNENNPQKFNSITILVYGVLPPILIAVSNWSVTTLMDGKGKMKEIFMMVCYSYLPVMVVGFANIVLSNVVTFDEAQFIEIMSGISWFLTAFMVLTGLLTIHEYGLGKVLLSVIATILAALIIAFIGLLIFNLAEQIYGFIYSFYKEFATRYL